MRIASTFAFIGLLLLLHSAAVASSSNACTGPDFEQLDFRVGTWNTSSSEGSGTGVVTKELNGCVIIERLFDPANPQHVPYGMMLSSFRPNDGAWELTWVDQTGRHFDLRGYKQPNGSYFFHSITVFEGRMMEPDGEIMSDEGVRIFYENITRDRFSMRIQNSDEEGAWKDFLTATYERPLRAVPKKRPAEIPPALLACMNSTAADEYAP